MTPFGYLPSEIISDPTWSTIDGKPNIVSCSHIVDTKYFTAPVEFWDYTGGCPSSFEDLTLVDGIVLFFKPSEVSAC